MSALDVLADWPVPTAAAAVIGPTFRGEAKRRGVFRPRHAWGYFPPVPAGLGHQAPGGPRRPGRGGGGRLRTGHAGRSAGRDGAPSAGAHLRVAMIRRPGRAKRRGNEGAGRPRDPAHLLQRRLHPARRGAAETRPTSSSAGTCTRRCSNRSGWRRRRWPAASAAAGYGAESSVEDLARFAAGSAAAGAGDARAARRGDDRAVPRPERGAAGLRIAAPERLGAGVRDPGWRNRRTGPGRPTRPGPTGISASPARSCGSIRPLTWPWWCSPTATSGTGRTRCGQPSLMES